MEMIKNRPAIIWPPWQASSRVSRGVVLRGKHGLGKPHCHENMAAKPSRPPPAAPPPPPHPNPGYYPPTKPRTKAVVFSIPRFHHGPLRVA